MLTKAQLEQMGGRTTVSVPVPSLNGQEVELHTPTAFARDRISLMFAEQFDALGVDEGDESVSVGMGHIAAMRAVFGEAIALTLLDESGEQMYPDSEEVRKAFRSEVVDELGQHAWGLFGIGKDAEDEAVGNSGDSTVSDSTSG